MSGELGQHMPVLVRHEGWWQGTYRHMSPAGELEEQYSFVIHAEFPEAGDPDYRQTSHYTWEDGRTEDRVFEARYSEGRLRWDDGRIFGSLWEIDDQTIYLKFGYHSNPASYVCEMMQLSPDSQHRARTWHWFSDHRLSRVTLVEESRMVADAFRAPPG